MSQKVGILPTVQIKLTEYFMKIILTTSVLMWFSVSNVPCCKGLPLSSYQVKVAGGSAAASQVRLDVPEMNP